jgi:hypothetical protein
MENKKHLRNSQNDAENSKKYPDRFCETCNRKYVYHSYSRHLKSKKHLQNLDETRTNKKSNIFCETCNKTYNNYKQHLKTRKHLQNLDGTTTNSQNNKTYPDKFCKLCNIPITYKFMLAILKVKDI